MSPVPLLLKLMDMADAGQYRSVIFPTSFLSFAFLIWLAPMLAANEEMRSIYAGTRVVLVRLGSPAFGPESLAFDHRGGGPYTGVSNGRILRWKGNRRHLGWTEFAYNYKHM
ncbi:Strictosidine synthase 1 [Hordeum vulgare]|nr:Strictosidine synthase 1 [Hordeum vulgare]